MKKISVGDKFDGITITVVGPMVEKNKGKGDWTQSEDKLHEDARQHLMLCLLNGDVPEFKEK